MFDATNGPYYGREQAFVKHEVLRRYLQSLAFKVGHFQPGTTINYIDGFSGPWDAVTDDHGDSSPAIAMRELAASRDSLARAQKEMLVRCLFVEKNPIAYERLVTLCKSAPVEAHSHHGEFEGYIAEATRFAREGRHPFAFVFIDPTGWTGFSLRLIAPLLQTNRCEVLINFMLKDIARFIDDADSSAVASFEGLFGQDATTLRARWKDLSGLDREDEIVRTYCGRVKAAGRFEHCASTVIVNPTVDRTHYHLVFATRSRKGLATFREAERTVTPYQQDARARAKVKKIEAKTGQLGLLGADEMDSDYFDALVVRYRAKARASVEAALTTVGHEVSYEALVDVALAWPMTSETELKSWISDMQTQGRIEIRGLAERARTPKLNANHRIRRIK